MNSLENSINDNMGCISFDTSIDSSMNTTTDSFSEHVNKQSKNIKVVCRIRPLNEKEKAFGNEETIVVPSENANTLLFKVN